MSKKVMRIHNQPKRYMKKCGVSLSQARQLCKIFNKLRRKNRKVGICPYCKKRALEYESSGDDYCSNEYILCTNCWETFDCDEIKAPHLGDYFDVVLTMVEDYGKYGEFDTREEWLEYVDEEIRELVLEG